MSSRVQRRQKEKKKFFSRNDKSEKVESALSKKEEKKKKKKKQKVKTTSRKKFRRLILVGGWALFLSGFAFGVYKNFTAIDKETIVESHTVTKEIKDVSGIETFVKQFARVYYSASTENNEKDQRDELLANYMQEDLTQANRDMFKELKEKVVASDVQIWDIQALDKENKQFTVLFTVEQRIGDKSTNGAYLVTIYRDNNSFVVTKNPHVTSYPSKADYKEAYLQTDESLNADQRIKVEEFLKTFFTLYPKANEKELVYYVKDQGVSPINRDFSFIGIDNLVIKSLETGKYEVACFVNFKDNETTITYSNQYNLILNTQEDGELIISEMR